MELSQATLRGGGGGGGGGDNGGGSDGGGRWKNRCTTALKPKAVQHSSGRCTARM
jgi:hypothetical protein